MTAGPPGRAWRSQPCSRTGRRAVPSAVAAGAGGIHINDFEDILDGTDNWVEITSGLVAGKGPLSITSVGPSHTWMGATGGYIYFTDDPRGGVSVQDAGGATIPGLR